MSVPIATIPRKVSGGEELVVIKKGDFYLFQRWQEEMSGVLAKVKRGREEYRRKKTVTASSPHKFR